jgi:TfuA protein
MSIDIFVGPSISSPDRIVWETLGNVRLHAPVRRGDLLTLDSGSDDRILIIDGEFGQSLAVAVTEIRELARRGSWIGGASSMGALRAVECAPLGVARFGWVAAAYAAGAIVSDAEVALIYDPETYRPLSIPLVNIRWMTDQLARDGSVDQVDAGRALAIASRIHYRDRSRSMLAEAWSGELAGRSCLPVLTGQTGELTHGRWDRKRLDAFEALSAVLGCPVSPGQPLTGPLTGGRS